jgi:hypothetical protein
LPKEVIKINTFPKKPSEKYVIKIDFSEILQNETISSATVSVNQGTTSVTSDIVDTILETNENVNIKVKNGTNNLDYKITSLVTTTNDNFYEENILMQVREGF